MEDIGRRMVAARRAAGLKREEVAVRAGVSMRTVEHVEQGKSSPTVATLRRMCDVLGLSLGELFSEVDQSEVARLQPAMVYAAA